MDQHTRKISPTWFFLFFLLQVKSGITHLSSWVPSLQLIPFFVHSFRSFR